VGSEARDVDDPVVAVPVDPSAPDARAAAPVEPDPALYRAVFESLPTAYLVMTPDLCIVDANPAYLNLLGRRRADIVGRPVFEAFPPSPDDLDSDGRNPVQTSFERARDERVADAMPLQRYGVTDTVTGEVAERYWSLISAPVLDDDGEPLLVLQRVEDVTDYVHERQGQQAEVERGREWMQRVEAVEADLFLRLQELRVAQHARDVAALRLASLGEVALQLATATTLADLERIVVGRGMAVLGADGGAVLSRAPDGGWRLSASASLGADVQQKYATLPYDSPLPACWTARTGQRLLLLTAADGIAFDPGMADVHADTGHRSWATLPLLVRDECLGCLAVSWVDDRPVARDELDLLESLAAQCAQALDRMQALDAERRAASEVARMSETMQLALLTEPPQPPGLHIAVRYRPAAQDAQVGGDWYDAFVVRDATCLVVGDVSGHDREAAAAMSQLRNLLRGIAYAVDQRPAGVLTTLDHAVHDLQGDTLATLVLAEIAPYAPDDDRHTLTWANAGHLPPLLVRPDGTVELLEVPTDLMLGVLPDVSRRDHTTVLEPGSTVMLYTDGLVERRDESLGDSLDELRRAVRYLGTLPLEDMCDAVLGLLRGIVEDDIALLAVRTGVPADAGVALGSRGGGAAASVRTAGSRGPGVGR
jgi:PAS domain S-box-containing protein